MADSAAPPAEAPTDLSLSVEIPSDERGVLIPKNLSQSVAFAKLIVRGGTNCIPRGLQRPNTQEQIATLVLAFQYGADLGLTPMKALRSVMVVNGTPGIYGEGPVGIVASRDLLEDMKDEWSGKPFADDWTVTVTVKRKGRPSPTVRSFSWAQAKKARLTEKQGPWTNYPDRMMYHRAKSFAIRDAFPDIIGGFLSEDELDEIRAEVVKTEVTPTPTAGQTVETGPKPRGRKKATPDAAPVVDADFTVGATTTGPATPAAEDDPNRLPPVEESGPGGENEFNQGLDLKGGPTAGGPSKENFRPQDPPPVPATPAPAAKAPAPAATPKSDDPFGGLFDKEK